MQTMVPLYGFGGGSGGTGATLTVTAPSGCTVTVTKDGKTKIKVADSSGLAVFKGLASGEWTISITDGEQTAQKTVTITADYSTAIAFFSATIHITYPAGSVCTATDGTTTLTAPNTSGTWDCVVPNAGTWTVSLNSGFSETVTISESGEEQTINKWHLYNLGDQHTAVTGGWGKVRDGSPTFTANEQTMYVSKTSSNGRHSVTTYNKIDLTNVSAIKFTVETNKYNRALCLIYGDSGSPISQVQPKSNSKETVALDVSSISGKSYVGFGVIFHESNTYNITVYDVYITC